MKFVAARRVEIIADAPLVPRILTAFAAAGIAGHTVLPAHSGNGRSGDWTEDRLTGAASKVVIFAISSEPKVDALVEALAPILDSHRLLLSVADVGVVRDQRFV